MNEINKDQRPLPDYTYEVEMLKRAGIRVCIMPYQGPWCNDCKQFLHCDILDRRKHYQVIEEEEIEMNEEKSRPSRWKRKRKVSKKQGRKSKS